MTNASSSADPPASTPVATLAGRDMFAGGSVTSYAVVAALITVAAIALVAVVVARLRRMNPVAFGRAVANGSLILCAKTVLMLVDVGVDVKVCVSVLEDPGASGVLRGLFGLLTVVAVGVSLVELCVVAHSLRQILTTHLDIDTAAEINRRLDCAEIATMCADDAPMLVITGFVAATSEGGVDTIVLVAALLSAFMLGLKCTKLASVLYHLYAQRSYETGTDEAVQICDHSDRAVLAQTLDDFLDFEAGRFGGVPEVGDDRTTPDTTKPETYALADGEEAHTIAENPQDAAGGPAFPLVSWRARHDPDVAVRAAAVLADFAAISLDMDAPQTHVDVFAVVLELVYPHRFQHLQRAAEATAQALTRDHVSQNEFYAVVLPYLMLLYDKEFRAACKRNASLALDEDDETPSYDNKNENNAAAAAPAVVDNAKEHDEGEDDSASDAGAGRSVFAPLGPDGITTGNDNHAIGANPASNSFERSRLSLRRDASRDGDETGFSAVELVRMRLAAGGTNENAARSCRATPRQPELLNDDGNHWHPVVVGSMDASADAADILPPTAQGATRVVDVRPAADALGSGASDVWTPVASPRAQGREQLKQPTLAQASKRAGVTGSAGSGTFNATSRFAKLARHAQQRQEREVVEMLLSLESGEYPPPSPALQREGSGVQGATALLPPRARASPAPSAAQSPAIGVEPDGKPATLSERVASRVLRLHPTATFRGTYYHKGSARRPEGRPPLGRQQQHQQRQAPPVAPAQATRQLTRELAEQCDATMLSLSGRTAHLSASQSHSMRRSVEPPGGETLASSNNAARESPALLPLRPPDGLNPAAH